MGVEWSESREVAKLVGLKVFTSEMLAYQELGVSIEAGLSVSQLHLRLERIELGGGDMIQYQSLFVTPVLAKRITASSKTSSCQLSP